MQVIVEGGDVGPMRILQDFDDNGKVKKDKSIDLAGLRERYFALWGDIETYLNKGRGRGKEENSKS